MTSLSATSTRRERWTYRFQHFLAWAPSARLITLLVITCILWGAGTLADWFFVQEARLEDFGKAFWRAWTMVVDPGTHVVEETVTSRIVSALTSVGGILFFAMLVGVVTEAIEDFMEGMRQGTARVIEKNHILIVGWNEQTLELVQHLCNANEYLRRRERFAVVILADKDKPAMDEEIQSGVEVGATTVICRSGKRTESDLRHVSASTAQTVVVLSRPGDDGDAVDAITAATVLVLVRGVQVTGQIVADLRTPSNAGIIQGLGPRIKTICSESMTGRLLVQCSRQPGLFDIYETLLEMSGSSFFVQPCPRDHVGSPFSEVSVCLHTAVVCGIKRGDKTLLNPPGHVKLEATDHLVLLGQPGVRLHEKHQAAPQTAPPARLNPEPKGPERVLICGSRPDLLDMVVEFDGYVAPGSQVVNLTTTPSDPDITPPLRHVSLSTVDGDPVSRKDLESVDVLSFDRVLALRNHRAEEPDVVDTDVLMTHLLIADMKRAAHLKDHSRPLVISELASAEMKALLTDKETSEFVVSSKITSLVMTHIALHPDVHEVFDELLQALGQEIYIQPVKCYIAPGTKASFLQLQALCFHERQLLIGLVHQGQLDLNPEDKTTVKPWTEADKLVVVAEDEVKRR